MPTDVAVMDAVTRLNRYMCYTHAWIDEGTLQTQAHVDDVQGTLRAALRLCGHNYGYARKNVGGVTYYRYEPLPRRTTEAYQEHLFEA